MNSMPSPTQSEFSSDQLPIQPSVEATTLRPADLRVDRFPSKPPATAFRAIVRFLIAFGIGVAATVAWQSYGDTAREAIARLSPQFGWLAPEAAPATQNAPDMIAPAASSSDQQQ